MKIVVAMKQVPVRDSSVRVSSSGKWIDEDDLGFQINEPDAYALEEALQLKEKHGGEVVVLSAGPERVGQSIREALAKGADRAIHVECDNPAALDTLGLAHLLAAAIRDEHPALILTGLQSDDLGLGQTGVVMAEILGIPHATIIMSVSMETGAEAVIVKRELEDGWFQSVELPLPALLTIQSGIRRLRYATLLGIKKARTKETKRVPASQLGAPPPPSVSVDRMYAPQKKKDTQLIGGVASEAAAALVERLRFEARVL